ncbi:DUF4920 domain-containing protein [Algoriphagus lutimaris]|uniref:DUF4920 domain-containing protein n=1 Tax=Algoriphagus lutimaris TaxID=613197 RepID=UPI00196A3763|nr:DUF4920 domain-containing protein [Algoriphagus lutimaris]MBN3519145.1 DUF4920 domain-containing protein [Algoriphagus lutimaris]
MKIPLTIIAFLALCIGFSCSSPKTDRSDLNPQDTVAGTYGSEVIESNIISTSEMVQIVQHEGTFEGKISGEITEVCSQKGCWLKMDLPNGNSMRVTFKNYEFFVPKNSQGFPMILEGVATLTKTSVKTLQHYAKDAGKSEEEIAKITEPKMEISFEAVGVKIKDKA